MQRARVLLVDDSVVIRQLLTKTLAEDPAIEVIGTASNGKCALARIDQSVPDIVVMDVEMPEMTGLEALVEIRKKSPNLPVIMFSTLTAKGAATTLDALMLGASDYVTKPSNIGSVGAAIERVRADLVPKIKSLCRIVTAPPSAPKVAKSSPVRPALTLSARTPEAIVIGVSTGGPRALATLLPGLKPGLGVPVFIVQHMPPVFTKSLADHLAASSGLDVVEAKAGDEARPGRIFVAPGGYHMRLERRGLRVVTAIDQEPPENFCRPAVDVLFRSAAAVYGPALLGVVLTGMGQDGFRGSRDIVDKGGRVLAQDQATSVVWGMPSFVAEAGLADLLLPIDRIAAEIVLRARAPVGAGKART